jgi:hypothetical protein
MSEEHIPEIQSVTWNGRERRFVIVDFVGEKHSMPEDFIVVRSSWLKRVLFRLFIFWWMICVSLVVCVSFLLPRWIAFVFVRFLSAHHG